MSLGLEKLSASSSIMKSPYYFAQTIISVLLNLDPKTYESIIPLVYYYFYSYTLGETTFLNYSNEQPNVPNSTSTGTGIIPCSLKTCIISGILIPVTIISVPGGQSSAYFVNLLVFKNNYL